MSSRKRVVKRKRSSQQSSTVATKKKLVVPVFLKYAAFVVAAFFAGPLIGIAFFKWCDVLIKMSKLMR
jgi:hypothetical protein